MGSRDRLLAEGTTLYKAESGHHWKDAIAVLAHSGTWPSYMYTLCLYVCVQCWLLTIALRAHAQHSIGGGDDQVVDNQSEE